MSYNTVFLQAYQHTAIDLDQLQNYKAEKNPDTFRDEEEPLRKVGRGCKNAPYNHSPCWHMLR